MPSTVERIRQQEPASLNAACKLWHVTSGVFEEDGGGSFWGKFWEPLRVDLPESARPTCCLSNSIVFYDRTGNKLLKDHVRHLEVMSDHPHLLLLDGLWREVLSGRVEFRDGQWFMCWLVAWNTHYARMLNGV